MILSTVLKALGSVGMKLLSEKLVIELVIWALGKLVKSTENGWDDELYEMALKKVKPEQIREVLVTGYIIAVQKLEP